MENTFSFLNSSFFYTNISTIIELVYDSIWLNHQFLLYLCFGLFLLGDLNIFINRVEDNKLDLEKLGAYECGFHPIYEARQSFDIKFYLVAILYLLFDLEVAFILPWVLNYSSIHLYSYFVGLLFFSIISIGLYYEWNRKSIEWV
jgi:NADH-quinone oxidoreductase subunit A